ncbi:MAG: DUF1475 family protein [PS1 clade bacterium]|nr:hypothetical protein [Rhodobiaceae bacterium]MBL6786492.1 DUF1475 family protein [PS1 clade bacterium]CAI8347838.1 MAG: Uncharacterised protein [Rhodobiaceae bacterium UBA7378]
MRFMQIIVGLIALAFIGLCALAYVNVGWQGFDRVLAEPWGVVTLADVMVGAVCMTIVIFVTEPDWRVALAWAAPIFVLGHVVSCVWVIMRFLRTESGEANH